METPDGPVRTRVYTHTYKVRMHRPLPSRQRAQRFYGKGALSGEGYNPTVGDETREDTVGKRTFTGSSLHKGLLVSTRLRSGDGSGCRTVPRTSTSSSLSSKPSRIVRCSWWVTSVTNGHTYMCVHTCFKSPRVREAPSVCGRRDGENVSR